MIAEIMETRIFLLSLLGFTFYACSDSEATTLGKTGEDEQPNVAIKEIAFSSSDKNLERTFYWAKKKALSYAHDDSDPVGYWYEAALPGRNAFCMRDMAHQSIAAEMLGLSKHNFNIIEKFAENISDSKDWCSYWEIDKDNKPCPADYVNDANFWYNLNANFDIIFACWRLYEWTGDRRYLNHGKLADFFRLSTNEYVERWKLEPENILLRRQEMNVKETTEGRWREVRGLPSYVENYPGLTNSSDLIASIYGGFEAYSNILGALGQATESGKYHLQAEEYRRALEDNWWNSNINAYHTFWTKDGKFADGEGLTYMLWFDVAQQTERIQGTVNKMMERKDWNIENTSHFPLLWYRYNYIETAYDILKNISTMYRSDYPEVSYGMVEGIVSGAMGIVPSASQKKVITLPKITGDNSLLVENLPVLQGYITVRHDNNRSSRFINNTPGELTWHAAFMGEMAQITVNGEKQTARVRTDRMGSKISYVEIKVAAGAEAQAQM